MPLLTVDEAGSERADNQAAFQTRFRITTPLLLPSCSPQISQQVLDQAGRLSPAMSMKHDLPSAERAADMIQSQLKIRRKVITSQSRLCRIYLLLDLPLSKSVSQLYRDLNRGNNTVLFKKTAKMRISSPPQPLSLKASLSLLVELPIPIILSRHNRWQLQVGQLSVQLFPMARCNLIVLLRNSTRNPMQSQAESFSPHP